ncbi:MAG: hypothetical protein WC670_08710 [Pseudolabrys sp.]|jgi:hypothetical protein
MKKTILAVAAAATVAAFAASTPAEARCHGCGVAAGVVGGLAVGAIIGSSIANSQPSYYAPQPGYVIYDGYSRRYPVSCDGGYWSRRPIHDRWGNMVGWSKPRFVCP